MKFLIAFVIGVALGALSWILPEAVTGKFEPFDNAIGFYLCEAILVLPLFFIGLRHGALPALCATSGAWLGMNTYAYAAGSAETRAWIVLLLFSSLSLLIIPAVFGVIGGILHALLRRRRARTATASSTPSA
ncbi:MAG: hypothetical protein E6Q88_06400 [Lysobacteraceae bacterium]|nr:MAG: hypothetical protein E6Q88_06400 [Xanthomonadaceae bacterium]